MEHNLEFISLKGVYTGSSESTLSKCALLEITCRGSILCVPLVVAAESSAQMFVIFNKIYKGCIKNKLRNSLIILKYMRLLQF